MKTYRQEYILHPASDKELRSASKKLRRFVPYIKKRISEGVTNSRKLHKELQLQGYGASYATVYRYTRSLQIENYSKSTRYKPSIRFETDPGEQAQVDWGSFGKIEINGRIEKLYCFVYILGYSRMAYIEFTTKQNLQTLENCHIHAFEKIGIPKTIVYDNMKTVVIRREKLAQGRIAPRLNPAFFDFAQYYNFSIFLCPPYWPRAKGKVEAGVKYVRNNFMKGMRFKKEFKSLEELNKKAQRWLEYEANTRLHGTTKEKPIDRWIKEKKYLNFPNDIPIYASSPFLVRRSTKDGLIQYKSNLYSVPMEYARRNLFVKAVNTSGTLSIAIYYQDIIVANHLMSHEKGKWIVDDAHLIRKSTVNKRENKKARSKKNIKKPYSGIGIRPLSYYDKFILGQNNNG